MIVLHDLGNDVLEVTETLKYGIKIKARGWVSALMHHYGEDDYDEKGNLKEGAIARAMTPDEKQAYAERLLTEQNSQPVPIPLE